MRQALALFEEARDGIVPKTRGRPPDEPQDPRQLGPHVPGISENGRGGLVGRAGAGHARDDSWGLPSGYHLHADNLGSAYQAAGEPEKALAMFQQAAAGLEKLDFAHAAAELIVWNLCDCLEELERFEEADLWRQKWLAAAKKRDGPDSVAYADELAKEGGDLLGRNRHADAEPFLRESVAILQKKQPESLTNFHAQSLLGDVLLGQKTYADAEPLLVQGYEGLKAREGQMPPLYARYRVTEAGQRIVQLYEAWGKRKRPPNGGRNCSVSVRPKRDTETAARPAVAIFRDVMLKTSGANQWVRWLNETTSLTGASKRITSLNRCSRTAPYALLDAPTDSGDRGLCSWPL